MRVVVGVVTMIMIMILNVIVLGMIGIIKLIIQVNVMILMK